MLGANGHTGFDPIRLYVLAMSAEYLVRVFNPPEGRSTREYLYDANFR
jgi:hypothetical protein